MDTLFPQIYGQRRGVQLRAYNHDIFTKLSVWQASEPVPDPTKPAEPKTSGTAAVSDPGAGSDAAASSADPSPGVGLMEAGLGAAEDLQGEGYIQIYTVMQPEPGATKREALFRFGSWVYSGSVDFGVPTLHLGDVPDVLPALQKQQGQLGFLCEASKFPRDHKLTPVVRQYLATLFYF